MGWSRVVPEDLRAGGFPLGARRAGIDRVLTACAEKMRELLSPFCVVGGGGREGRRAEGNSERYSKI